MAGNKREANIVMAKCRKSRGTFGIRIEKMQDSAWHCTWAFPLSEKSASREGYESTLISGKVVIGAEYPGCPCCGADVWICCSACKKMTCSASGEDSATCAWCGYSAKTVVQENFDLTGGGY